MISVEFTEEQLGIGLELICGAIVVDRIVDDGSCAAANTLQRGDVLRFVGDEVLALSDDESAFRATVERIMGARRPLVLRFERLRDVERALDNPSFATPRRRQTTREVVQRWSARSGFSDSSVLSPRSFRRLNAVFESLRPSDDCLAPDDELRIRDALDAYTDAICEFNDLQSASSTEERRERLVLAALDADLASCDALILRLAKHAAPLDEAKADARTAADRRVAAAAWEKEVVRRKVSLLLHRDNSLTRTLEDDVARCLNFDDDDDDSDDDDDGDGDDSFEEDSKVDPDGVDLRAAIVDDENVDLKCNAARAQAAAAARRERLALDRVDALSRSLLPKLIALHDATDQRNLILRRRQTIHNAAVDRKLAVDLKRSAANAALANLESLAQSMQQDAAASKGAHSSELRQRDGPSSTSVSTV